MIILTFILGRLGRSELYYSDSEQGLMAVFFYLVYGLFDDVVTASNCKAFKYRMIKE
jgi:hypothetical protein